MEADREDFERARIQDDHLGFSVRVGLQGYVSFTFRLSPLGEAEAAGYLP